MPLMLDSGDRIDGWASVAAVIDYTIHGLDNSVLKQLADGQLPVSTAALYTADSVDVITSIVLVNTHTAAVTIDLTFTPSGGTARRLIPKAMTLGIAYLAVFTGNQLTVYDAYGKLQSTVLAVADFLDDTAGGTDALLTKAPTSNALFDAIRFSKRNIIINGGFTINQRIYVSAAALAAGVYGHDRWKAGADGGNYSFTQLASPTTITIAANKTLIQVIENKMVYGGTYVLSWTGTCQARYAINSATPAGAYADSPIVITGQNPGTTMSVEFGRGAASGTLGLVQLELGSVATPFEFRAYQQELALCQRYYELIGGFGRWYSANICHLGSVFVVSKRAAPTLTLLITNPNVGEFYVATRTGVNSTIQNPITSIHHCYFAVDGFSSATAGNTAGANTTFVSASAEL